MNFAIYQAVRDIVQNILFIALVNNLLFILNINVIINWYDTIKIIGNIWPVTLSITLAFLIPTLQFLTTGFIC